MSRVVVIAGSKGKERFRRSLRPHGKFFASFADSCIFFITGSIGAGVLAEVELESDFCYG